VATHNCGIEAQNGATEVCTQVVAEVHPLDEEQDHSDPHLREKKSDPDF
jgi:hypothetical protein